MKKTIALCLGFQVFVIASVFAEVRQISITGEGVITPAASVAPLVVAPADVMIDGSLSASSYIGSGSGITNINAANISGALNLNANGLTVGTNQLRVTNGNVGVGTAAPQSKLDVNGDIRLNDTNIYFRGGADLNHGLGWYGASKLFGGTNIDGPVLFGYNGGALGTTVPDLPVLFWNWLGNVGIGTTSPAARLDVSGNGRIRGDLTLDGTFNGTVHVSKITGLLGDGFTLQFPDILNNLTIIEMEGIPYTGPVVILTGPGYDIERITGFSGTGQPNDTYGFAMEHPFIFEVDGSLAASLVSYFNAYASNPAGTPIKAGSIITNRLNGTEFQRWNFFNFAPKSYTAGLDGRTRFTLEVKKLPDGIADWESGSGDTFGTAGSYNPATDKMIEISGIPGIVFSQVTDDEVNRTLTFSFDIQEGNGIQTWVINVVKRFVSLRRDLSVITLNGSMVEIARMNYYGCFPIKFEVTGLGLDSRIKATIVLSYNIKQPA